MKDDMLGGPRKATWIIEIDSYFLQHWWYMQEVKEPKIVAVISSASFELVVNHQCITGSVELLNKGF